MGWVHKAVYHKSEDICLLIEYPGPKGYELPFLGHFTSQRWPSLTR